MPILRPHALRFHERHISSVMITSTHLYSNVSQKWPTHVGSLFWLTPTGFDIFFGRNVTEKLSNQ